MSKLKVAVGILAATGMAGAAMADHPYAFTGTMLETSLSGAEEVPSGSGDPDGTGIAKLWLNHGQSEICYEIMVMNIEVPAIGAHIHAAPAGQNGGVVLGMNPPGADGTTMGCALADQDFIKALRKTPSDYYINVHTNEYPAGAVRGQLSRKNQD